MRMKLLGKQWMFEKFIPGELKSAFTAFSIDREILETKTPYQKISIIENIEFGRMLFLNDLVQVAEMGDAAYHEMLVHPGLLTHPKPQKVLIIGGGDGGTLREVLKHPVREVLLAEIDKEVINVSKQYLPSISQNAFEDRRTKVFIEDGMETLKRYRNEFDCVILDSNDPDGSMAHELFTYNCFKLVKQALKPNGIFIAQTGYLSDKFGKQARKEMKKVFPFVWFHRAFVPYILEDEHTFSFASSQKKYKEITLSVLKKRYERRSLVTLYYSPEMHLASAVLPKHLQEST